MLHEGRARLHAGAAGGAGPQGLGGDDRAHERAIDDGALGVGEIGVLKERLGLRQRGDCLRRLLTLGRIRRVPLLGRRLLLQAVNDGPPLLQLGAQVLDERLGAQGLARGIGGAEILAAVAAHAGLGVEEILPRELLQAAAAEGEQALVLHVDEGQLALGFQVAPVDAGGHEQHVDELGIGPVGDEPEGEGHMEPPQHAMGKLDLPLVPASEQSREEAPHG